MATTKATLFVAGRLASIEDALVQMEHELENAEGSRKQMLEKWVAAVGPPVQGRWSDAR